MSGHIVMIQGTMSSVGKSLLVAALCRIFKQDGWRVAPFKAQNMALNSFATLDGREVGRAQAMQADAAGIDVTVEMNPVLLKPEADSFAQVVVMGQPWARLKAWDYYRHKTDLWQIVTGALDTLRTQYDLIVVEGAGSAAELNLKRGDLVNMAIAHYADAPVLLVGDIDRGGIFAQLLGTLMLLEEHERARVRGLIVNKFRGDRRLFDDGVSILEQRGGVPVLGVVPFIHNLGIADEDSVALDERIDSQAAHAAAMIDIAVIRLPRISNFDDFDPLRAEAHVNLRFVDQCSTLGTPDLVILPGTKTTMADLAYLRMSGLADRIIALAGAGIPVLGICGGYQILGSAIHDPLGSEADVAEVTALGLLPVVTYFDAEKQTVRAQGHVLADRGLFRHAHGIECTGYEIHMGRTLLTGGTEPLLQISHRGDQPTTSTNITDGAITPDGWIAGTYLHGLFDTDVLRHAILSSLAARKGANFLPTATTRDRDTPYNRLAASVRECLDMEQVYHIVGMPR